jgi:hypothetical protein
MPVAPLGQSDSGPLFHQKIQPRFHAVARLGRQLKNFRVMADALQIWMLIDAIRQREWIWALFLFFGWGFSAFFYYFYVYRASPSATRGFELPGANNRRRIKELQAQIHHLDKAHHHSQLGDIYFQQGKLEQAEACYRAA